jgi:hypothetical protein
MRTIVLVLAVFAFIACAVLAEEAAVKVDAPVPSVAGAVAVAGDDECGRHERSCRCGCHDNEFDTLASGRSCRRCRKCCCPRNWVHFDGSCYKKFEHRRPWGDAQFFCSKANKDWDSDWSRFRDDDRKRPNLVTINCRKENNFLSREFGCDGRRDVWIGLNRRHSSRRFNWISGSGADFRNFERDEPDRGDRCVAMDLGRGHRSGKWEGDRCGERHEYICEVSDDC